MTTTTTSGIRQQSRRLCTFVTLLLAVLAILLLLERFSAIGVVLVRNGPKSDSLRCLALAAVTSIPEVLYLVALYWIRQALSAFARGELFSDTITRMLDRVGIALAVGAIFTVFILPGVSIALGFSRGYLIAFDVSSMVLGAIGCSLRIIAHVLRNAAEQQAELDQIF